MCGRMVVVWGGACRVIFVSTPTTVLRLCCGCVVVVLWLCCGCVVVGFVTICPNPAILPAPVGPAMTNEIFAEQKYSVVPSSSINWAT